MTAGVEDDYHFKQGDLKTKGSYPQQGGTAEVLEIYEKDMRGMFAAHAFSITLLEFRRLDSRTTQRVSAPDKSNASKMYDFDETLWYLGPPPIDRIPM